MEKIVLMLKTYRNDILYVDRFLKTFHKHNADSLQLYLVAPQRDRQQFEPFLTQRVLFIADEEIPADYALNSEEEPSVLGHWNPGIVRLAFWKLGLCENYFAIDSDMVFLRNFYQSDFILPDGRPYIFVTENASEKIDPFYFRRYWDHRGKAMGSISRTYGAPTPRGAWAHNSQTFNAEILKLMEKFVIASGLADYKSLMEIAPYEFFWYASWALNQTDIDFEVRDELVKMINHQGEHLSLWERGVREADLARAYIGVIVNSNWSRQYGLVNFDSPPVAEYRSKGKWAEWVKQNIS